MKRAFGEDTVTNVCTPPFLVQLAKRYTAYEGAWAVQFLYLRSLKSSAYAHQTRPTLSRIIESSPPPILLRNPTPFFAFERPLDTLPKMSTPRSSVSSTDLTGSGTSAVVQFVLYKADWNR